MDTATPSFTFLTTGLAGLTLHARHRGKRDVGLPGVCSSLVGIGKVPAVISPGVTFGLLAGGVRVLVWKTRGQQPAVGGVA